MTDRIALVRDSVVVDIMPKSGSRDRKKGWLLTRATPHFLMDGGTVQRVPDTVQVGDRWPGVCRWTYDAEDDAWESDCGNYWQFIDGGPADNNFGYCHGCGHPVSTEGDQ